MTRYTLHVPGRYNDGSPVPSSAFAWIKENLLGIGGGFTMVTAVGAWRGEYGRVYREPVRLYHMDAELDFIAVDDLRSLMALHPHPEMGPSPHGPSPAPRARSPRPVSARHSLTERSSR
jgi:hypothetical protein